MAAEQGLRERKKAQTRQAIAEAAQRLFAERGFDAVTVAEVAREADVSQGTVFNYFPTKEELFYSGMVVFEAELVEAVRARPPGESVLAAFRGFVLEGMSRLDDSPNQHLGSAYDGGWYVYANKDLRTILRPRHVRGRFSRIYCGQGRIGRCRSALLNSLASVLNTNPYGENAGCGVGDDQMCYDAIHYRSTGGITQPDMEWQNRPTFQQTVEIPQAVP